MNEMQKSLNTILKTSVIPVKLFQTRFYRQTGFRPMEHNYTTLKQSHWAFSGKTQARIYPSAGLNVASLAAITFQEVEWLLYNLNVLFTECVCQFILEGIAAKGYRYNKSWC